MKQEQFKNVYQQISLTEKQKDAIWHRIETRAEPESIRKCPFLSTRAAAFLGVLLISSTTVYAANELSLIDKITEAMNLLTQNKETLTEDQKNIYEQYGQLLDREIALDNGTLTLDAVLYDQNHLLIPFRYIFESDIEGYEDLITGTNINQPNLYKPLKKFEQDQNTFLSAFRFCIVQDTGQLDEITASLLITNSTITADSTISGSLLLYTQEYKSFEPGYVIQLVRSTDTENAVQILEEADVMNHYELYAEFTLRNALEQHELTIDAENAAALEDMGISIERMTVSPLSLCYAGKGTHTRALSAPISVILKDGSIVKTSPNGGGYALRDTNRDNTSFSFFASKVFAAPVPIEEIAAIQIQDNYHSSDIIIPFE